MNRIQRFRVYEAESGESVEAIDATSFAGKNARFILTEAGVLAVMYTDAWEDLSMEILPRGKYLVRFCDEQEFRRW